jgi:hypothetical protein
MRHSEVANLRQALRITKIPWTYREAKSILWKMEYLPRSPQLGANSIKLGFHLSSLDEIVIGT